MSQFLDEKRKTLISEGIDGSPHVIFFILAARAAVGRQRGGHAMG